MISEGDNRQIIKDTVVHVALAFLLYKMNLTLFVFPLPLLLLAQKYPSVKFNIAVILGSMAFIAFTYLFPVREMLGDRTVLLVSLVGLFIPLTLLASTLVWVVLEGRRCLTRYVASCITIIVLCFALFGFFCFDEEVLINITDSLQTGLDAMFPDGAFGNGAASMVALMVNVVKYSFIPTMMLVMGGLFFLTIGRGQTVDQMNERVSQWKLNDIFLYAFLIGWTLVVIDTIFKPGMVFHTLSWNLAIACTVMYFPIGASIVCFWILKRNPYFNGYKFFVMLGMFTMILPGLNFIVLFVLPLLGVTENWITYRKQNQ